jgi:mono/diheme cytochrome c family protein
MKSLKGLGAGLLVLSAVLVAAIARGGESDDVRAGRALYEQHCMFCHGAAGKGDGPLADDLRVAPADLTTIAKRRAYTFPDVEVREIIDGRHRVRGHGGKEMPIWGQIFGGNAEKGSGDEAAGRAKLEQLVAYLRSIQVSPPRTVGQLTQ